MIFGFSGKASLVSGRPGDAAGVATTAGAAVVLPAVGRSVALVAATAVESYREWPGLMVVTVSPRGGAPSEVYTATSIPVAAGVHNGLVPGRAEASSVADGPSSGSYARVDQALHRWFDDVRASIRMPGAGWPAFHVTPAISNDAIPLRRTWAASRPPAERRLVRASDLRAAAAASAATAGMFAATTVGATGCGATRADVRTS
jgi:hypothetical protein